VLYWRFAERMHPGLDAMFEMFERSCQSRSLVSDLEFVFDNQQQTDEIKTE